MEINSRMKFMTIISVGRASVISTVLTLAIACSGCGGGDEMGRVPVSGTATYQSVPIVMGSVTFRPEDPAVQSEELAITDGKFSGKLIPGKRRYEIRSYEIVTPDLPANTPEAGASYQKQLLPEKFNDKSEMTIEIDGKAPLTFDL